MIQEEEKVPPKKYAIKPPRDLSSRFEQEQEMKKQQEIKVEEEKRRKEEEQRLLVGPHPQPPCSALQERRLATENGHRSGRGCVRGPQVKSPPPYPAIPQLCPAMWGSLIGGQPASAMDF